MSSPEMLEWLKAIGTMACSWPAIALLVLIVFRRPLFELIGQLIRWLSESKVKEFTLGPFAVKLQEMVEKSMGQLQAEAERTMTILAEQEKKTIDAMEQLDEETERKMDELARKSQMALDNTLRLHDQMAESNSGTRVSGFVHVATEHNTVQNHTTIDNPLTNNTPNAILIITPNWSPPSHTGGVYDPQPVGVWYTRDGKWSIFNQDKDVHMPIGAAFNVLVVR